MKNTTGCLVLILLAHLASVACTSKGRSSADAQPGVEAASCINGICVLDSGPTLGQQDASSLDACSGADQACLYSDGVLAVGESGGDGCSTYSCGAGGKLTCTVGACAGLDAGVPADCSLPTRVEFGLYGGFGVDDTNNTLDTAGKLTADLSAGPCVSELPACGTPCAITVGTIAKDLADPEAQAAFASAPGTLFGVTLGAGDVANFRITLGDGRSILVGFPCCRLPGLQCQPIPTGVQRLVNDLQALLAGSTGCP